MALIHGRPFLDLVIEHAASQGFRRIVFCTGYRGEWIAEHVRQRADIEAVLSHETEPLGTAGALRVCRRHLRTELVLVLNGDSFCPIDLAALLAEHRRRGALATVAVVPADGRTDGGGISVDGDGRITAFREQSAGSYLNAGVYALESLILDRIPARAPCSLERDVVPSLIGQGLYASIHHVPLHDIGTPARLHAFRAWIAASTGSPRERAAPC
jgi:NDP-sugar pyrophosphorylase family protein